MSKSLGNGVAPEDIIKQYGADILRLWVASSDYHADIRISPDIMKQLSEGYRKIRNTARYILSNLADFNPNTDMVPADQMPELDLWALHALNELIEKADAGYNSFDFHVVYHAIHNFCVLDMSNFYLDIIKDRLYCEKADSLERRSAQSAIYTILSGLTRLVAPILAFTSEEIWASMPHLASDDAESVLFNDMPKAVKLPTDEGFIAKWDRIHQVRDEVNKALERKRNEKVIGKSLEAKVTLFCSGELRSFLDMVKGELESAFIVSQVELAEGTGEVDSDIEGLSITISKADGEKCERCWAYRTSVGQCTEHPTLCERCAKIVSAE